MTLYAGERVTIVHSATADGVALTPDDAVGVFLTVYSPDWLTVVLAETEMTWNADKTRWEYSWITAGITPGTYRVRVRIEGVDEASVWEYGRVSLKTDKALV